MIKIREKIKNWLFKEEILEFKKAQNNYNALHNAFTYANVELKKSQDVYSQSYKLVDECHKLINSIIDVGTDIGFRDNDHSWAVICIKGHPEYVKFIPLTHKDARDVIEFLKHFKYSNKVIDSPFAFKEMVKDNILDNLY